MDSSGVDSNSLILPPKSKSKLKPKPQIIKCHNTKLSNSQKRKLKKLEEEKEKQLLLSKSLENLDKYKISDDAHSLLWSSQNIGQTETMLQKRRRAMQFSKAGLDVPATDMVTKKMKVGSCETEEADFKNPPLEFADKNISFKPVFIKGASRIESSYLAPSQVPGHQNSLCDLEGTEPNGLIKEVTSEDSWKFMNVDAAKSSASQPPDSDKNTVSAVGELNGGSIVGVKVDPIQGPRITPTVVNVSRPKDVEDGRKDLPIIMMEQEIMETINNHSSVIICGETGCGKTTQIPQFLYEAGYGSAQCPMKRGIIGVTQPRRVAVLSTAKRVALELGFHLGKEVGFQVRHDRRIGENCSIKFMTDGILLRELQSDFLLKRYSVIILDEAHERSLNTDILIGMLSRVVMQRQAIYEDQQKVLASHQKKKKKKVLAGEKNNNNAEILYPLKLILMSATLRVEDFTAGRRIFHEPPPVINIPTRQFPVTTHFSKKTVLTDYINESYRKVLKIHKRLPSGGILVFVTGQKEVDGLCRMLRQASEQFGTTSEVKSEIESGTGQIDGYTMKEIDDALDTRRSSTEQQMDRFSSYDDCFDESDINDAYSSVSSGSDSDSDFENDYEDLKTSKVDDKYLYITDGLNSDSLKAAFEGLTEKTAPTSEDNKKKIHSATLDVCSSRPSSLTKQKGEKRGSVGTLHVLPLYAMLPAAAQLRVFDKVKEGERLVVVATNVAETSLTIPGIRYVVDTGKEKVKHYNPSNGMESYEIQWISKASAAQRAGRAGRTGPGHCYCLYSSAALSNQFSEFSCAEILKTPIDGVILLMKSMGISKVANFPFPTPPNASSIVKSERCLMALEALDSEGRLTPLGKTMAQYPLSPRHSRLLLLAIQIIKKEINDVRPYLVLGYAVAVAAALSSSNPFSFQFDGCQSNSDGMEQKEDSCTQSSEKNGDQGTKLTRKQMKRSTKLVRAKFYNIKSDALTVAYTLQCFEQSKDPSQFCKENTLHLKVMVEMSKLRKQLLQLVFNQRYSGLQQEFLWTHGTLKDVEDNWRVSYEKKPLWENEEDILCQAICAGWADMAAMRIGATSVSSERDRKVNADRYQASLVEETVFLHGSSSVSRAAQFLVYNELLCTKRPYIYGATCVKTEWLVKHAGSLCTYSAPSADALPFYDPPCDQVFCYVMPSFGPHLWKLPQIKVPIKDVQQRVSVFAYALLDGQVLPCLKSVKKYMASPPSIILKPEALGQKRVGNLLSKLRSKSRTIDNCAMLKEAWDNDPHLLHSEILDWFQDGFRRLFEDLWGKMHQEAFQYRNIALLTKTRKTKASFLRAN